MGAVRVRVKREVPKFILLINFFVKQLRRSIYLVFVSKFTPTTVHYSYFDTYILYNKGLRSIYNKTLIYWDLGIGVCFVALRPPLLPLASHRATTAGSGPQNTHPRSQGLTADTALPWGPGTEDAKHTVSQPRSQGLSFGKDPGYEVDCFPQSVSK
jgi:hypothetical protein